MSAEDGTQLVCYCFEHRIVDIQDDVATHGHCTIADAVLAACRAGQARCAERNPAGVCCLGRLRSIAKAAAAENPSPCCGPARVDRK